MAYVSLALATVNFVRYYIVSLMSYLSLRRYALGTERMPFQGRMLLMWPLRWAGDSALLRRMGSGRTGALRQPELAALNVIGLVAVFAAALLVTRMYRLASKRGDLPYLPWALMIVVCSYNYTGHLEQNFLFPYDLASLAFFTAGIYLIYTRRFAWLLVLFPIATLNRETTLFLIPLVGLDAMATQTGLDWRQLRRGLVLAKLAALSVLWGAVELYVHHRFAGNATEAGFRVRMNLAWLSHPKFWPAIAGTCAYLLPFLLLLRTRIADERVRAYVLILWPWIAFMFVYGQIVEERVYGELCALVALAATLILEETLAVRRELAELGGG